MNMQREVVTELDETLEFIEGIKGYHLDLLEQPIDRHNLSGLKKICEHSICSLSADESLVEVCELIDHPWMVSCQFHPEFGSSPGRPHPLFLDFVGAARDILREGAQPSLPLNP